MTINQGILTAQSRKVVRLRSSPSRRISRGVVMIPLWRAILVTTALCSMVGTFVYSVRPETAPEIIHIGVVETHTVKVATCAPPASLTNMRGYHDMVTQLAATIPATALQPQHGR